MKIFFFRAALVVYLVITLISLHAREDAIKKNLSQAKLASPGIAKVADQPFSTVGKNGVSITANR